MRVGIIGAGPGGATAAYALAKRGVAVDLYEASGEVGGLARTLRLWNQRVDLGPHRFFSRDKRVNEVWLEVVGPDYRMVDRLTRIFYEGRFFYYPLRPANALWNLGPAEAVRCLASYALEGIRPTPPNGSFESWVTNRFGRRLFEIFFKTYSEKLWGISCSELDSSFAAQRIRKVSLAAAVLSSLRPDSGKRHKTFVDQFAYPLEGTGMVYERMARFVREHGGRTLLNTPVRRVLLDGNRATALELMDGTVCQYDHIVSTMPLSLLIERMAGIPANVRKAAASLAFRNTILVFLRVAHDALFPDNWLYVHSPSHRMGRITNFRNWIPSLYGEEKDTVLAVEFWANDDEPLWRASNESLIAQAESELRSTGLLGDAAVTAGHVEKVRRCYPIYRSGYLDHVGTIREHLAGFADLQPIGRYGSFKYNNQDHSILMGLLAADNILDGAGHDLWEVNTDYDDYQEEALITEAGLRVL